MQPISPGRAGEERKETQSPKENEVDVTQVKD